MNTYLENLKKNYFYTIIVGMIISLPLFLVFDILSDETICTEPDYSGDLNECLRITANANEIGWVLFTFPIGMALMSGMFHYFPVIKPTEEQKSGVSFGFILAFIFSRPLATVMNNIENTEKINASLKPKDTPLFCSSVGFITGK